MSVTYLTTPIVEVRTDPPPRGSGMTRDGYTKRSGAPTHLMIRLQGEKRWRRLMVWQFSNSGTMFVKIDGKPHVVRQEDLPREGASAASAHHVTRRAGHVHHTTKKSPTEIQREIDEALASGAGSTGGRPSNDKLQQAAKWIRRELTKRAEGGHPSHLAAKLLKEADEKFGLGSFGVEGWAKSPSVGVQYLNYGDPYDATIVVRSSRTGTRVSVALGGWESYA